jgi:hypothetical protein
MLGKRITPYRYANRFEIEQTTGPNRLCIGAAEAQISLLWKLAFSVPAPYYVLYVLHNHDAEASLAGIKALHSISTPLMASCRSFASS